MKIKVMLGGRVADSDYFGKLDPDPQKNENLDPIRFKVKKNSGAFEAQNGAKEGGGP